MRGKFWKIDTRGSDFHGDLSEDASKVGKKNAERLKRDEDWI